MASTSLIARAGSSAFLAGHTHQSDDALPAIAARPAFVHQRVAKQPLMIRGQQSPFRTSEEVPRQGSVQPGVSNVGRRSTLTTRGDRNGNGINAAPRNADPGELRVTDISSHQKTAGAVVCLFSFGRTILGYSGNSMNIV